MIMVADASPLIFLGKIGQLGLIPMLFPGKPWVPASVREELLIPPISPAEEAALLEFLKSCQIVAVTKPTHFAAALSKADNEVLTLAVRRKANFIFTDDRLLRQLALVEGIRPMGTLGILLRSLEKGFLTKSKTRQWIETLVQQHQFRISIEVYDATLQRIEGFLGTSNQCCL